MSGVSNLKRDGTMEVTAQAGMKFLESHGMKVTDDDAKTRSQKDKLEQLVSSSDDQKEELEDDSGEGEEDDRVETTTHNDSSPSPVPNVVRDGTMKVTAKEGNALLGGEKLAKTRGQTARSKSPTPSQVSPSSKIKRTTTIALTAQDSSNILGMEELGRTRSQTRKISDSGEDERKSPAAVKRAIEQTLKAGEESPANEAKRAKLDNKKIPEVDETTVNEETKAEA